MLMQFIKPIIKASIFVALITSIILFSSCHNAKEKTKAVINKTGETVGEGASEFVKGVAKGVQQTLDCSVVLDKSLLDKGVSFGKFKIGDDGDARNSKLTIYLVFDKNIKQALSAKVFDKNGDEYGRSSITIEGKAGEAKYYDFIFDKRTDIESKSSFVIQ